MRNNDDTFPLVEPAWPFTVLDTFLSILSHFNLPSATHSNNTYGSIFDVGNERCRCCERPFDNCCFCNAGGYPQHQFLACSNTISLARFIND